MHEIHADPVSIFFDEINSLLYIFISPLSVFGTDKGAEIRIFHVLCKENTISRLKNQIFPKIVINNIFV